MQTIVAIDLGKNKSVFCEFDRSSLKTQYRTVRTRPEVFHNTVGIGHLYQGRYKSFPVQDGLYYQTLMRYVESNPLRAGLVTRSADWPWSSLAIRCGEEKPLTLSDGPIHLPRLWKSQADKIADVPLDTIETCIQRGRPFGDEKWILKAAKDLALESSLRPRGRPKKEETV